MFCLAVIEKIVCLTTGPTCQSGTCILVTHSYCVVIAVDQVIGIIEIEQCFSFEYLATC